MNIDMDKAREAKEAFNKCAGIDHQDNPKPLDPYNGNPWTPGQIIITLIIILLIIAALAEVMR